MSKKLEYVTIRHSNRGVVAGCVMLIIAACILLAFPLIFFSIWGVWGISAYRETAIRLGIAGVLLISAAVYVLKHKKPDQLSYMENEDEWYLEDEDSYMEEDGDSPELNAASSFEPPTPAEMLHRYRGLVQRGYMSEEEFQQKRLALLGPDSPEPDESSAQPSADSSNIASQLTDLVNLLDRGLISRDEFEEAKKRLF